jgi:hypothetical protein
MQRAQAKLLTKGDLVHCGPVPSPILARSQPCLELQVTRLRSKWRTVSMGIRTTGSGYETLIFVEAQEVGNPSALHYFHPGSTLKHLHLASICKRATTLQDHPEADAIKYPRSPEIAKRSV